MSNMIVTVGFEDHADLRDCLIEAKQKAEEWGVAYVKFFYGSGTFEVSKNANIEKLWEDYYLYINIYPLGFYKD